MSRIPPGLLYLTIYNPTLSPAPELRIHDDEDAEEQAHILFYTARERAVSRDRMLRQVGLAKALINFTELLDSEHACENTHSLSRRMIMVAPEPDYWIHACFEIAKVPRPALTKNKGKDKGKAKKAEQGDRVEVVYDYQDSSLHDNALRAHILQGYEDFKLTHGSFTSIILSLGQQALELQLERFFTVWAWKWDIEEDTDFASYLGLPLHPHARFLTPILDEFASETPEEACAFALAPPYVIPSSKFSASRYPTSLTRHIISRIAPLSRNTVDTMPPLSSEQNASTDTVRVSTSASQELPGGTSGEEKASATSTSGTPTALSAISSASMGMDLRNLKWGWPGYWTFGKGPSAKPDVAPPTPPSPPSIPSSSTPASQDRELGIDPHLSPSSGDGANKNSAIDVDSESLQEAISTDYMHSPSMRISSPASVSVPLDNSTEEDLAVSHSGPNDPKSMSLLDSASVHGPSKDAESQLVTTTPDIGSNIASADPSTLTAQQHLSLPAFMATTVYLAEPIDSTSTHRRRVWHFTSEELTFALLTEYEPSFELQSLIERALETLFRIRRIIAEQEYQSTTESSIPTATKILQPQDTHLISMGGFTTSSSSGFRSKSEHLFNAQQTLQKELSISEIFSRGQNPQHWHVVKRDIGFSGNENVVEGEVYMEVAKKESTLTDVDNELAAITRKFVESGSES